MNVKRESEEKRRQLEAELASKSEAVEALRKQLDASKAEEQQTATKLQDLQAQLRKREEDAARVEAARLAAVAELASMQSHAEEAAAHQDELQRVLLDVTRKLKDVDARRLEAETALGKEREHSSALDRELVMAHSHTQEVASQQALTAAALETARRELATISVEAERLKRAREEQERTLMEMGDMVSATAMRAHEMEDRERKIVGLHWADATATTHCHACQREFTITRRKHHCRRCGKVFCNECSDNRMPLPSSAKAVRVCDACQTELLKAMSKK